MKPKQPKIKQVISFPIGEMIFIYGLGKDNKMYYWSTPTGTWELNHAAPAPKEPLTSAL